MKYAFLLMAIFSFQNVGAQMLNLVHEEFIAERTLGKKAFIQADFNGDGEMEFLADANNAHDVILGKITQNNDIQILQFFPFSSSSSVVLDIRYEDTDGDGHIEIYILIDDVGLIQYDTSTFLPIDTITTFNIFYSYRKMILKDIDDDQIKEWVLLDESKGMSVINPITHDIIWSNPLLTGENFFIENLDDDPSLELTLIKYNMITILDLETLVIEHTISNSNKKQVEILDMDADGDLELVYLIGDSIIIYDHKTKTSIDQFEIDLPFSIDYFIPINLDGDPALELLLTSETFGHMVEVNTFPMENQSQYKIEGIPDIGFFIGRAYITSEPEELLFTLGDYQVAYAGLVRYNPISHLARLTNIRCEPNAQLLIPSADGLNSYLMTRPSGSRHQVVNVLLKDSFSTFKQIRGEDVFIESSISLDPSIFSFHEKGKLQDIIAFSNQSHLCFYNLKTDQHHEFYSYLFTKFLLDDLDFDGAMELITIHNDGIRVYKNTSGYGFVPSFSTIAISSSYNIRTAQLDQSRSKEILAFLNNNLFVFNGETGGLIRNISDMTDGSISDITAFSDGMGQFYIALVDPTKVYIYNFTNQQLENSFPYSNSAFTKGSINSFSNLSSGTLSHFLTTLKDTLKVFTTQGNLLFKSEYQKPLFYDQARIIIDDSDQDYYPNIITSSEHEFSEYKYIGPGDFIQPFYLTEIFPNDSVILPHSTPFILEFSEVVSISSVYSNVNISSTRLGNLNFIVEQLSDYQIKITPDAIPEVLDTINITIQGGLQSKLFHFLDTNHDELSLVNAESPVIETYLINPTTPHNIVEIVPIQPLPAIVYTQTNRHLPFAITSQPDQYKRIPIMGVQFGIRSPGQPQQYLLAPTDLVYDEYSEEVLLPLNTFSLTPGDYIYYLIGEDFLGEKSDSFFFGVKVIQESGDYDKNPGGDFYRTLSIPNQTITSNFKKVAELSHSSFSKLSHVVGGAKNMFYTELPSGGSNALLRNINLSTFETTWERSIPMYSSAAQPHLNNGILYISNTFSNPKDPEIGMYDIQTGQEILTEPYNSNAFNDASPITNEKYIIIPDNENHGVYCMDRWTGKEKWYVQTSLFNTYNGSPSLFNNKAYSVLGNQIQCINTDTGIEIWKADIDEDPTFLTTNALIDTLNHQLIWSGDDNLYAFDSENGTLKWKVISNYNSEQPVLYNNEIFHFSNDSVRVFKATNGAKVRQKKPTTFIDSQPVASNGKLFIPYFNKFEVWDINTLSTVWTENIGVNDISIIDQYLILASGNKLLVYKSADQCCNSSIRWTEAQYSGFSGEVTTSNYTFDSISISQNGKDYFEILSSNIENGGNWTHTGILIRNEGNKIYQGISSGEVVLMDFNLKTNDVFISSTGIEYTVIAIDSIVLENGELRKRLELHCPSWGDYPVYWIEGIGSTAGLANYDMTCYFDVGAAILCFYQNESLLYQNPEYNTCWLNIVSTGDTQKYNISYFPNPLEDQLIIQDPEDRILTINIYNLLGHAVYSGNSTKIETGNFTSGLYNLSLSMKNGQKIIEKIIKL
jgi:outer membrane protein assembly factor BamB